MEKLKCYLAAQFLARQETGRIFLTLKDKTMKKFIACQLIIALIFTWFNLPIAQAYNQSNLSAYLNAHNTSAWSVMGLAALGESSINANHLKNINTSEAINLTAPILAIAAINQNPHTFGSTDYVQALQGFFNQGQLGDTSLMNDDIFGLLALVAAGENPTSENVITLKNYIISHQNPDHGWGFMLNGPSDSNMTAAALLALKAAQVNSDQDAIQNAWQYLRALQQNDGGFAYDNSSLNSDGASTAWVLWSINAWQQSLNDWLVNGQGPVAYLESLQSSEGYFVYQPGGQADNFTSTMSAYAAIALSGHFLPIDVYTPSQTVAEYNFRIEGASETICAGKVAGPTALDIVINASNLCGFTYHITETAYGPYLDQINNEVASGLVGWMYLVNYQSPAVGAAEYQLSGADTVLWYFGNFDWLPSRLSIADDTVASGQAVTAVVESFTNNQWQALTDATIYFGAQSTNTDSQGRAQLTMPDGYYRIYAEKQGWIRSNQILVTVGTPSGAGATLSVNINNNGSNPPPNNDDLLSFVVEPGNIDFGNLAAGQNAQRSLSINNNGTNNLSIAAMVNGDNIFLEHLQINNQVWSLFDLNVNAGQSATANLKLSIPNNYSSGGQKTGSITFWSNQ